MAALEIPPFIPISEVPELTLAQRRELSSGRCGFCRQITEPQNLTIVDKEMCNLLVRVVHLARGVVCRGCREYLYLRTQAVTNEEAPREEALANKKELNLQAEPCPILHILAARWRLCQVCEHRLLFRAYPATKTLFEKPHRVVCCYPEHVYETAQRLDLRWMREGITFGQETDMR